MPTPTAPMPGQESSQVRSAWSARSYDWQLEGGEPEGCYEESAALVEHPAKLIGRQRHVNVALFHRL
jgi:hypothetical protein